METKIFVSAMIRGEESAITKRCSVTAITLRHILSLLNNALCCRETLLFLKVIVLGIKRAVIATESYRSGKILAVIASKSYCSDSQQQL